MAAADLNIEQLWSVKEVMHFLGAKRSWVYARVRAGELPHIRLGGQMVRFVPDDVKRWALALKKTPLSNVVSLRGQR